jgi:hypothetical protein
MELEFTKENFDKLLLVAHEVHKVWNEDGDCGTIQRKTPIAWYRVLRLVEDAMPMTDREKATLWWSNIGGLRQESLIRKCSTVHGTLVGRRPGDLTGREVEMIWGLAHRFNEDSE